MDDKDRIILIGLLHRDALQVASQAYDLLQATALGHGPRENSIALKATMSQLNDWYNQLVEKPDS